MGKNWGAAKIGALIDFTFSENHQNYKAGEYLLSAF